MPDYFKSMVQSFNEDGTVTVRDLEDDSEHRCRVFFCTSGDDAPITVRVAPAEPLSDERKTDG